MKNEEAIQKYQCLGCVLGPFPTCYDTKIDGIGCSNHCVGTLMSMVGKLFLGMPKGFDRLGGYEKTKIYIFHKLDDGWGYTMFNVPVWKHLDKHGNTLVRGYCPRINMGWIHVFLTNEIDKIDCIEITIKDMENMD